MIKDVKIFLSVVFRRTGPSRREVISLQKVDSLLMLECSGKVKRFLQDGTFGIRALYVVGF
ncbi:MAG: hypothetical protein ACREAS_08380 [Nitrososphaera sp.]